MTESNPRRSTIRRALGKVKRRLSKLRPQDEALGREGRAVRHGIARYKSLQGSGSDLFLLRRNVHMMEKGLTMQPRRAQFATGYVEQTVTSFSALRGHGELHRGAAEYEWMSSVLTEYFSVTAASDDPAIVAARTQFELIVAQEALAQGSGPHAPTTSSGVLAIEELEALAAARRSVRWFTPERVPREAVDRAVTVAAEAPTACNRQPYRFHIFDDPASVAKVAAIPMGAKGYAEQIPGIIVIVGDLSAFFDERDRHLIYVDGCLAAMSLIFALEAQGIGSCCINWPDMPEREAQMRELLGLRPYERVVMLIAYGHADQSGLVPFSAKRDLEDVRVFRDV